MTNHKTKHPSIHNQTMNSSNDKVSNFLPGGARRGSNFSQNSATESGVQEIGARIQFFIDLRKLEAAGMSDDMLASRYGLNENDIDYDQRDGICNQSASLGSDWESQTLCNLNTSSP